MLYVLVSIPGAFALVYVPSKLIVNGNAAATARSIAASETLFRIGIACNLIRQILFMWVALALYDLLKGMDHRQASLMLGIDCAVGPDRVAELAERNRYLILVRGADFLPIFEKPQKGRSGHAVPQSA